MYQRGNPHTTTYPLTSETLYFPSKETYKFDDSDKATKRGTAIFFSFAVFSSYLKMFDNFKWSANSPK